MRHQVENLLSFIGFICVRYYYAQWDCHQISTAYHKKLTVVTSVPPLDMFLCLIIFVREVCPDAELHNQENHSLNACEVVVSMRRGINVNKSKGGDNNLHHNYEQHDWHVDFHVIVKFNVLIGDGPSRNQLYQQHTHNNLANSRENLRQNVCRQHALPVYRVVPKVNEKHQL